MASHHHKRTASPSTSPSAHEDENEFTPNLNVKYCYKLKKDYVNLLGHFQSGKKIEIDPTDVRKKGFFLGNYYKYNVGSDFIGIWFVKKSDPNKEGKQLIRAPNIIVLPKPDSKYTFDHIINSYFEKTDCIHENLYLSLMASKNAVDKNLSHLPHLPRELWRIIGEEYQSIKGGTRRKKTKKAKTRRHRYHKRNLRK
jgi:hypothetical protein